MRWVFVRSNEAHNLLAFRLPDGDFSLTVTMTVLSTLKVLKGSTEIMLDNPSNTGGNAHEAWIAVVRDAVGPSQDNVRVRYTRENSGAGHERQSG